MYKTRGLFQFSLLLHQPGSEHHNSMLLWTQSPTTQIKKRETLVPTWTRPPRSHRCRGSSWVEIWPSETRTQGMSEKTDSHNLYMGWPTFRTFGHTLNGESRLLSEHVEVNLNRRNSFVSSTRHRGSAMDGPRLDDPLWYVPSFVPRPRWQAQARLR